MAEAFSPLVGVSFRGAEVKEIVRAMTIGETDFLLESEFDNPYDEHAVKVLYGSDEIFVGYLAKGNNLLVAQALRDDVIDFDIEIVSFENTFKPLLLIRWEDYA